MKIVYNHLYDGTKLQNRILYFMNKTRTIISSRNFSSSCLSVEIFNMDHLCAMCCLSANSTSIQTRFSAIFKLVYMSNKMYYFVDEN